MSQDAGTGGGLIHAPVTTSNYGTVFMVPTKATHGPYECVAQNHPGRGPRENVD